MTLQHQNHRRSTTCHRHPSAVPSSGSFCTSCLSERLEGIGPSTIQETPNYSAPPQDSLRLRLRRSKSYSAARHEGDVTELRRRSCDSRCQESLSDLLVREGSRKFMKGDLLSRLREEDEHEIEEARDDGRGNVAVDRGNDDGFGGVMEVKTMKEFIDLECKGKKQKKKDIRVLWEAASAVSKKFMKLRRKDKVSNNGGSIVELAEDVKAANLRETQLEFGEYGGLGRRSCDSDPRFSLDARFPVDDMRCSFDKPRASWDGYLGGTGRTYQSQLYNHHRHERCNSMVSFTEKTMVDERLSVVKEDERSPGGSFQTRDYYKEPLSTQRRRRSFERSNSQKKGALLEVDELKCMLNAKISPATNELFYGAKLLIAERESMGSNTKKLKDECLGSAEADAGVADVKEIKKLHKWGKVWNIGGIMQRLKQVNNGELSGNTCKVSLSNHGFGNGEDVSAGARTRENCVLQRNQTVQHYPSPSSLDHGLLRFHLAPSPSSNNKCIKSRLRTAHTLSKGVI